ncbi:hypothetical protein AMAG_05876 [Allomyces macrogynus ATCC 38327]|uniref:Uncharacterized protein n=1 Tax=Allomyces macrogynus (strain ATCC 38327) TaxID=578462 RepID=A0A0L0SDI6_ALLM3|nr:hypothetical protein AMAG_05876 [Allomyces macrogynus ATCC 38327]|eukprot:KNE60492.1 hypothetical protein AMAG_05876 [Allomyces macrogynus ATCC 38327]
MLALCPLRHDVKLAAIKMLNRLVLHAPHPSTKSSQIYCGGDFRNSCTPSRLASWPIFSHARTSCDHGHSAEMPPFPAMTVLDAGVAMLASISPSLASQFCRDHFIPAGWPRPDFAGLSDDTPTQLMCVTSLVSPIPVTLLAPLSRAPALQQVLVKSCENHDDDVLDLEYHADRFANWNAIPTLTMEKSWPARVTSAKSPRP